jgi:hypothetical protein
VCIDTRWPAGDAAATRKYAAELVALSPDGYEQPICDGRSMSAFPGNDTVSRCKQPPCLGRLADTTADPKSSTSGNGDLQHLHEMTLRSAQAVSRRWSHYQPGWRTLVVDLDRRRVGATWLLQLTGLPLRLVRQVPPQRRDVASGRFACVPSMIDSLEVEVLYPA